MPRLSTLRGDSAALTPTAHDGRALIEMELSNGLIDDVRIYNEVLPATGPNSVLSIYQAQVAPEPAGVLFLTLGTAAVMLRRSRVTARS